MGNKFNPSQVSNHRQPKRAPRTINGGATRPFPTANDSPVPLPPAARPKFERERGAK